MKTATDWSKHAHLRRLSPSTIVGKLSPYFRAKRFEKFRETLQPQKNESLLDIGGFPGTWTVQAPCLGSITTLNLGESNFNTEAFPEHHIETATGDACQLKYPDQSFDIVFSNSVIEHVSTWENQQAFAQHARRTGKKLWIQTPARCFFLEPHYLTPFIHWLPKETRRKLVRYGTVWGLLSRPSQELIDAAVDEIRLLNHKEMKKLFPDCKILKEKFLGVLTKSYVAYRV